MKRLILAISLGLMLGHTASAGPIPLWQNLGFTNKAPTVDAVSFDNRGEIVLTNSSVNATIFNINDPYQLSSYVFDTQNTRYFTNRGAMVGTLGFQFDTVKRGSFGWTRVPAQVFTNSGTITAVDDTSAYYSGVVYNGYYGFGTTPSYSSFLKASATSIGNTGLMAVGDVGLMQISGKDVDLSLGGLAAGTLQNDQTNFNSDFFYFNYYFNNTGRGYYLGTNGYVNPNTVQDIYWFTATNTVPLLALNRGSSAGWMPLDPFSTLTNTALFQAWAYTNAGPTNTYVNIVFVRTNNTPANFSADVRFGDAALAYFIGTNFDINAMEAIVRIGAAGRDSITGQMTTNSFFLLDSGAIQGSFILLTNLGTAAAAFTQRPSCFEVATSLPVEWTWAFAGNIDYSPELIYPGLDPTMPYTSAVGTGPEAQYGAQIGRNVSTMNGYNSLYNYLYFGFGSFYYNFYTNTINLSDPTNEPARIEINGDRLNLSNTRIRSEGLLSMKTKHLVAGAPATIDAGNMVVDFASTNGFLCISNILPSTFTRSRGNLYCWGFNWANTTTNDLGTNYYKFHVLVVDHAIDSAATPSIRDLALHATNIYDQDTLYVTKSVLFDGQKLTFNGPVTLVDNARTLGDGQAPKLKDFLVDTNGVLYVDNDLNFGTTTPAPINSFTNRGQICASYVKMNSAKIENSGVIMSTNSTFLVTTNSKLGTLILTSNTIPLMVAVPGGNGLTNQLPVPSRIESQWDTEIDARVMKANFSVITNGMTGSGTLRLNVSDELSDDTAAVPGTNQVIKNYWHVKNGFQLLQKPGVGDLFGTRITTTSDGFRHAVHTWSGEDRGRSVTGFSNNVVIGQLVLDRKSTNCVFEFQGTGVRNAMYVDYLEFADSSYDNYNGGLLIRPNMVIYFADSNVDPSKLTNSFPGKLIWVPEFVGPNSSFSTRAHVNGVITDVYANRSLVLSKELDSNGDGTPNFFDSFPLDNTFVQCTATVGGSTAPNIDGNSLIIGTKHSVTAVPARGYIFSAWVITNSTGVVSSNSPSLTFAMEANLAMQAQFVPDPSYLQLTIVGAGQVGPDLTTRALLYGAGYQLVAKPAVGSVFGGWTGDVVSSSPTVNFVMRPNFHIQANFITNQLHSAKGTYTGLFFGVDNGTTNVTFGNSGAITFTVTENGTASGRITMASGSYPFTTKFGYDATADITVKRPASLGNLVITVTISADSDCTAIGSVTDNQSFVSELHGFRLNSSSATPATTAGYYTFAMPSAKNSSGPAGDVYGTLRVTRSGSAAMSTRLPDGTSFTYSSGVSANGHFPLFYTRGGRDLMLSMITFDTNDASVVTMLTNQFIGFSGKAYWTKNASAASRYYKDGFTTQVDVAGSLYKTPAARTSGLLLNAPIALQLSGGNLDTDSLQEVTWNGQTVTYISARKDQTLTIDRATGYFSGRTVDGAGKVTLLNGIVLPRQNMARGCFYGSSQSGEVLLHNLNEF